MRMLNTTLRPFLDAALMKLSSCMRASDSRPKQHSMYWPRVLVSSHCQHLLRSLRYLYTTKLLWQCHPQSPDIGRSSQHKVLLWSEPGTCHQLTSRPQAIGRCKKQPGDTRKMDIQCSDIISARRLCVRMELCTEEGLEEEEIQSSDPFNERLSCV